MLDIDGPNPDRLLQQAALSRLWPNGGQDPDHVFFFKMSAQAREWTTLAGRGGGE